MLDATRPLAIITGASSGIGKALAFEFAAGGFNVLLTARNGEALAEIAAACAKEHGVETEVVAADLACIDSIEHLLTALAAKPRRLILSPCVPPSPAFSVIPGTFFSASCTVLAACWVISSSGTRVTF